MAILELDYMEYANDGAAQAAYVSSDATPVYSSDRIPTMTSHTEPSGVASASSEFNGYKAWQAMEDSNAGEGDTWHSVESGGDEGQWWLKYDFGNGIQKTIKKYRILTRNWTTVNSPRDWVFQGSNNDSDWDTLDTQTDQDDPGQNVWFNDYIIGSPAAYRYYRIYITDSNDVAGAIGIAIGEIEMMEFIIPLQCYSESTIKQQGSYSLEVIAAQTESLNDTLTKSGLSIDLSDKDVLKFWAYASRTGTNIQIQIHDSGGQTSTKDIIISQATTWTEIIWDISGIDNVDKDDIDSIIIKIIEASAENTFYIDNIYAQDVALDNVLFFGANF